MEQVLKTLSGASGYTLGIVVALALMGGTFLLLPRNETRLLKVPLGFLIAHVVLRGVQLLLDAGPMERTIGLVSFAALLVCVGRTLVLLLLDAILRRRLKRELPKIIRDIIQGVVYFVLLLGLLRQMGLEPGQLLTTSALLTAVVGLSLQDTLGNLIAGLAVQVQRPFSVGDWVQFDNDPKNIGRVVEINWRATTLVTLDQLEVVVPNGVLAKSALRVYTRPSAVVRRSIFVTAGYDVAPSRVHDIILQAARDAPGILKDPPPTVVTNNYTETGIEYWVRVFIEEFQRRDIIDGGVRDRIWYAFQRAGISMPFPNRTVHVRQQAEEAPPESLVDRRERALRAVDFLKVIGEEQRRDLAQRVSTRLFSQGEVIVHQGDESDELFLIMSGETAVVLEGDKGETEITRLGPGRFFGEMALVTREKRKATVRATRDCELMVIDHGSFEAVLQEQPEVVDELSRVLAERQLELDVHTARMTEEERASVVQRESSQLLGKIKKLFKIQR